MSKKLKLTHVTPKTFVLETKDLVFIPNQPTIKKATNERYCCCVHVCSQFLEYPVDKWGRRIIPSSAICPHVKTLRGYPMHCTGDFVYKESKDGKKFVDSINNRISALYKIVMYSKERD